MTFKRALKIGRYTSFCTTGIDVLGKPLEFKGSLGVAWGMALKSEIVKLKNNLIHLKSMKECDVFFYFILRFVIQ